MNLRLPICDRAAEEIILESLGRAAPGVPVIAEEEVAAGRIPAHGDTYFLVDPLDGTKEFIRGGDDYTVNIGLIADGVPQLGVVYQPAVDRLWAGLVGEGAFVEEGGERHCINCRPLGEQRAAVASKSHLTQSTVDYLAEVMGLCDHVSVGSSLKFCIVAEGQGRHLPAPVADQRVGHCGGPCGAARGRRAGRWARRRPAPLWQEGLPQPRLLRHGRLGSTPPIGPFMEPFAGGGELPVEFRLPPSRLLPAQANCC